MTADVRVTVSGSHRSLTEAVAAGLDAFERLAARPTADGEGGHVHAIRQHAPHVAVLLGSTGLDASVGVCAELKAGCFDGKALVVGPAGDDAALLSAVKAGADGYVADDESFAALGEAVLTLHHGEARIPRGMLGTLLGSLIEARREDDAARSRYLTLSGREREVLALLARGCDAQQVAGRLYLSPHTVRTHVQNIFAKLEVHSRLEAVAFVLDHGLLEESGNGNAQEEGRAGSWS